MTEYNEEWYLPNHLYRRMVELQCLETPLPVGHLVDIELPSALHMNGKVREDDADFVVLWQNPLLNNVYEVLPKVSTSQDENQPYRVTVQAPAHLENRVVESAIEVEEEDELFRPQSLVGMFLHIVGVLDNDRRILLRGLVTRENGPKEIVLKELEIINDPVVEGFVGPIRGYWGRVELEANTVIDSLLDNDLVGEEESMTLSLDNWSGDESLTDSIDAPYASIPDNWYRFDVQEAFLMPGVEDLWIYYGDPQSIDVIDSSIDVSDRYLTKSGVLEFTRPGRDWQDGVSDVKNARAIWRGYAEEVTLVLQTGLNFGIATIKFNDLPETEVDTFSLQDGTLEVEVASDLDPDVKHVLTVTVAGKTTSPSQLHNVGIDELKVKIPAISIDKGEQINLSSWGGA